MCYCLTCRCSPFCFDPIGSKPSLEDLEKIVPAKGKGTSLLVKIETVSTGILKVLCDSTWEKGPIALKIEK